MLKTMTEMLNKAKQENYAVPHFNINNLEWTKFVLEQCEELASPVILGVSEGAVKYMGGFFTVSKMVKGLLKDLKIKVPVALHLDHGSSFEMCQKAIDSGFSSVMIDASKLSILENIEITKKVVSYAKNKNVSVESEVGAVGGEEDGIANLLAYAKVEDAINMATQTNIDALAPALGSVHGIYKGEPKLDFERMKIISNETKIPLVLHGGSGIPDNLIRQAIACGICKININTELQLAWNKSVREFIRKNKDVYDPRKIIKSGEKAMKDIIKEKVLLLGSQNKA